MTTTDNARSVLGTVIGAYLELHRALGRKLVNERAILGDLKLFLVARGADPLTAADFDAWALTLTHLTTGPFGADTCSSSASCAFTNGAPTRSASCPISEGSPSVPFRPFISAERPDSHAAALGRTSLARSHTPPWPPRTAMTTAPRTTADRPASDQPIGYKRTLPSENRPAGRLTSAPGRASLA